MIHEAVRLKIPQNWIKPPVYVPHPDSLLRIERCVWDLTPLNPLVPVKFRKCPRCGKFGTSAEPLALRTIYVEECETRRGKRNAQQPSAR